MDINSDFDNFSDYGDTLFVEEGGVFFSDEEIPGTPDIDDMIEPQEIELPEVVPPEVETPEVKTPEVKTPKVETPEEEEEEETEKEKEEEEETEPTTPIEQLYLLVASNIEKAKNRDIAKVKPATRKRLEKYFLVNTENVPVRLRWNAPPKLHGLLRSIELNKKYRGKDPIFKDKPIKDKPSRSRLHELQQFVVLSKHLEHQTILCHEKKNREEYEGWACRPLKPLCLPKKRIKGCVGPVSGKKNRNEATGTIKDILKKGGVADATIVLGLLCPEEDMPSSEYRRKWTTGEILNEIDKCRNQKEGSAPTASAITKDDLKRKKKPGDDSRKLIEEAQKIEREQKAFKAKAFRLGKHIDKLKNINSYLKKNIKEQKTTEWLNNGFNKIKKMDATFLYLLKDDDVNFDKLKKEIKLVTDKDIYYNATYSFLEKNIKGGFKYDKDKGEYVLKKSAERPMEDMENFQSFLKKYYDYSPPTLDQLESESSDDEEAFFRDFEDAVSQKVVSPKVVSPKPPKSTRLKAMKRTQTRRRKARAQARIEGSEKENEIAEMDEEAQNKMIDPLGDLVQEVKDPLVHVTYLELAKVALEWNKKRQILVSEITDEVKEKINKYFNIDSETGLPQKLGRQVNLTKLDNVVGDLFDPSFQEELRKRLPIMSRMKWGRYRINRMRKGPAKQVKIVEKNLDQIEAEKERVAREHFRPLGFRVDTDKYKMQDLLDIVDKIGLLTPKRQLESQDLENEDGKIKLNKRVLHKFLNRNGIIPFTKPSLFETSDLISLLEDNDLISEELKFNPVFMKPWLEERNWEEATMREDFACPTAEDRVRALYRLACIKDQLGNEIRVNWNGEHRGANMGPTFDMWYYDTGLVAAENKLSDEGIQFCAVVNTIDFLTKSKIREYRQTMKKLKENYYLTTDIPFDEYEPPNFSEDYEQLRKILEKGDIEDFKNDVKKLYWAILLLEEMISEMQNSKDEEEEDEEEEEEDEWSEDEDEKKEKKKKQKSRKQKTLERTWERRLDVARLLSSDYNDFKRMIRKLFRNKEDADEVIKRVKDEDKVARNFLRGDPKTKARARLNKVGVVNMMVTVV